MKSIKNFLLKNLFKLNLKFFSRVSSKINIHKLKYELYSQANKEIKSLYKIFNKYQRSSNIESINSKYFNKSNQWIKNYSRIENLIQYFSIFKFVVSNLKKKKEIHVLDYGSFFCFGSIILNQIVNSNIDAIDLYDEKDVRKFISCIRESKNIRYTNISKLDKFKLSKKDLIIMYDVLDSLKLNKNEEIYDYFDNLIKFFYRNLRGQGKLVISTFETSTKIKLIEIIKILSKNNFNKIELFFNFDGKRFVIFASMN